MGVEAASTSVSSAISTQSTSNTSQSSKAVKSDSSFKDEMSKVSESGQKENTKTTDKKADDIKNDKKSESKDDKLAQANDNDNKQLSNSMNQNDVNRNDIILNAHLSMNDANNMLSNNIQQMIENSVAVNNSALKNWSFGIGEGAKSSLKINESDADFFVNLTKNDSINVQSITAQAQNMVNNGADIKEVKQNVQVSQTLLNALSEARENNQPLRIDFDQNVSVILRVGKDGAVSAQFIPGDKAVEQYLRNNIDALRVSFDEQDLPYSELSYSNASKEQNRKRREEKRQGE